MREYGARPGLEPRLGVAQSELCGDQCVTSTSVDDVSRKKCRSIRGAKLHNIITKFNIFNEDAVFCCSTAFDRYLKQISIDILSKVVHIRTQWWGKDGKLCALMWPGLLSDTMADVTEVSLDA